VNTDSEAVYSCLYAINWESDIYLAVVSVLVELQAVTRDHIADFNSVQKVQEFSEDGTPVPVGRRTVLSAIWKAGRCRRLAAFDQRQRTESTSAHRLSDQRKAAAVVAKCRGLQKN